MRTVKSSNIKSVEYDVANKTLITEFANGGKYIYEGVDEEAYNALCGADDDPDVSFGSYFYKNVKSQYVGKRLEAERE